MSVQTHISMHVYTYMCIISSLQLALSIRLATDTKISGVSVAVGVGVEI